MGRWVISCALALLAADTVVAGDAVVARTLLQNGKKAVTYRKYDEAVTLLRKALVEDPDLAEAAYWIGVALDRSKDDLGALAAYRDFLAILDRKGAAATPEEKKLRGTAQRRVDALAAGEKEFRKLEDMDGPVGR
jgi:tetratricopeptide (TPR) repeat protein